MGPAIGRRTAGVLVALLLVAAGAACGGSDDPQADPSPTPSLSSSDRDCRDRWVKLGRLADREAKQGVSLRTAFAGRWNSIAAGIDYYAKTATSSQCGAVLKGRKAEIRATAAVVEQALPWDAGDRFRFAKATRAQNRTLPGGDKEPKDVAAAYAALQTQTPLAEKDLRLAYSELAAAEPSDKKAVAKAVSDVKLLADTSDAYRACDAAFAVLSPWDASLRAKKPSGSPSGSPSATP